MGNMSPECFRVISTKDGTLIAASGTGIVNEDVNTNGTIRYGRQNLFGNQKLNRKYFINMRIILCKISERRRRETFGDWQYDP
jgi:hypothetical protein